CFLRKIWNGCRRMFRQGLPALRKTEAEIFPSPKRRERWTADLFLYMEESRRTVHSRQSLIPERTICRIRYTDYYFYKTAQFREKEELTNGKKSIYLCGCADQSNGGIPVFPGSDRSASRLQR